MTRVLAAADIGSNTAHLLVAATDGSLVMRIDNYNEWIPLGEMVARQGSIPKEISQNLVLAMKEFKRVAGNKQAASLYVFATEAVRVASNHEQVLSKILDETGIVVDVISPRREAELSLGGVMLDVRNLGVDMMWEVGGGSAQIGRVVENTLADEESLPLGTGRIIAESGLFQPCPDYALEAAQRYVDSTLKSGLMDGASRMPVASGGVARGLWRALHPDGEKHLAAEELDYLIWSVAKLPTDRIVARFGVKNKRASTLLPGAMVYRALLKRFGASRMLISEFGIREGAVLEMARSQIRGIAL